MAEKLGRKALPPSCWTLKKADQRWVWCAERESGLGYWSQDFVPSTVPPRPWLLAFKAIRHAEVWAPLSWNEGSGGGSAASLVGHAHLPECPSIMHGHTGPAPSSLQTARGTFPSQQAQLGPWLTLPRLVLWPSSYLSPPWFSSGRVAGLPGAGACVGWEWCAQARARPGSVIPAFLGLGAWSSSCVFWEAGGTGPEAGNWRVDGDREVPGKPEWNPILLPHGRSQSYVRVSFPGFLQQRIGDPSVFLGLARFLCVAGLLTP